MCDIIFLPQIAQITRIHFFLFFRHEDKRTWFFLTEIIISHGIIFLSRNSRNARKRRGCASVPSGFNNSLFDCVKIALWIYTDFFGLATERTHEPCVPTDRFVDCCFFTIGLKIVGSVFYIEMVLKMIYFVDILGWNGEKST